MSHLTRLIRFVRHWHARVGVLAALFLILLASTGLLLNHTEYFRLDEVRIRTPWLLRWYGLSSVMPQQGYLTRRGYAVSDGQRCILNDVEIRRCADPLVGLVEAENGFYLATAESLYLFDSEGRLLERLGAQSLPALPIQRIGLVDDQVVIATAQGMFKSVDGITWQVIASPSPSWSIARPLPPDVTDRLHQFFTPDLSLERIILDLHSGRILGRHGPFVMDLVAVVSIALSVSGLWIYLRSIRKGNPEKPSRAP
ncbi:MAG: PepSY domain-containing protein [Methylophilaceae bacterium]|nr:PepSY domain-containing protein [Methylophilaceae bacterium]